jgi:hypothetical protein
MLGFIVKTAGNGLQPCLRSSTYGKLRNGSLELPEACLNIWCIVDKDTRLVYRLAARAYAIGGSDSSKRNVLKFLAHTDYHLAKELPTLKKYITTLVDANNEERTMVGGMYTSDVKMFLPDIIDRVCMELEVGFPIKAVADPDNPYTYKMKFSNQPYYVLTYLIEDAQGNLKPAKVRKRGQAESR